MRYSKISSVIRTLEDLVKRHAEAGYSNDANIQVSLDVSTGDNDVDNRIWGNITEITFVNPDSMMIIAEETSRNF